MQTIIVIFIVGLCVLYIGRRFYRNLKSESPSCHCADGCSDCSTQSKTCEIAEEMTEEMAEKIDR